MQVSSALFNNFMHFTQRTHKKESAFESFVMNMIDIADFKRWEEEKDRVNFYFEELSTRRQCVGFLVIQETEVENPAPAIVRVYDYYQKERSVSAVSFFCLALTIKLIVT
jgi:hypothetical protein